MNTISPLTSLIFNLNTGYQAIHLSLRIDVLIGNIQVCVLRYVLQQSRVVSSLQAYLRVPRITHESRYYNYNAYFTIDVLIFLHSMHKLLVVGFEAFLDIRITNFTSPTAICATLTTFILAIIAVIQ